MKLKIKTLNKTANEIYLKHDHFHEGDAGIDLYIFVQSGFESVPFERPPFRALEAGRQGSSRQRDAPAATCRQRGQPAASRGSQFMFVPTRTSIPGS